MENGQERKDILNFVLDKIKILWFVNTYCSSLDYDSLEIGLQLPEIIFAL